MRTTIAISLLGGLLLLTGCKTNACKDVDCGTHGTCQEGACLCEPGFAQDAQGLCNTRVATEIAGVYEVDISGCNPGVHQVTVQPSGVFDENFLLVNLGGYTCPNGTPIVVEAALIDATNFDLLTGPYCGQYEFSGSGTVQNGSISLSFDVQYESPLGSGNMVNESCQVTLTPQ